ncbi:MAG: hypothetical protein MUF49_29930 [Oculatellaceae cyanobacterium Prado106]|nr:hypothetical protein [Oculatellaceae cyanobacterium Prado106]
MEQAQIQLQQQLAQRIDGYHSHRIPIRQWVEHLRNEVFQAVLNRSRLQQLALEAQKHELKTAIHQYAIRELLQAIRLSGKLARSQLAPEVYQDAVNQTLLWVCQNLQAYDPNRGEFMSWVNFRLDRIGRSTEQAQQDSYTQATQGKIIRTKYQLSRLMQQLKSTNLLDLLKLYVKRLIPDLSFPIIVALVTLLSLAVIIQQSSRQGDLLYEVAQELVDLPPRLIQSEDLNAVEIAQEEKPSLVDLLKQYVEDDPDKLLQKSIKGYPQLTLQVVILARLEGTSWTSLSQQYGVKIPTLSNFFQRSLISLAPKIRAAIQQ